jgi:hypothetical protein
MAHKPEPGLPRSLDDAVAVARQRGAASTVPLPSLTARRLIREMAGIRQAELSVALGFPQQAVGLYEGSMLEPMAENRLTYRDALLRLAKAALEDAIRILESSTQASAKR